MTIQELRKTLPSKKEMSLDEHEKAVSKDILESLKKDMLNNRSFRYECMSDPEGDCVFLFKVDLISCSRYYVAGAWDTRTLEISHFIARMMFQKWAAIYVLEN